MDKATLCEIIERAGYEPRSYSGRAMYGKRCVSFSTDDGTFFSLANVIEECPDVWEAAELVRSMKSDNMGLGMVLYWPRIEWTEEEE